MWCIVLCILDSHIPQTIVPEAKEHVENMSSSDVVYDFCILDSHNSQALAPEAMKTFENSGISST